MTAGAAGRLVRAQNDLYAVPAAGPSSLCSMCGPARCPYYRPRFAPQVDPVVFNMLSEDPGKVCRVARSCSAVSKPHPPVGLCGGQLL
jgi:hypothetical protein